jgi:hypothetical protein
LRRNYYFIFTFISLIISKFGQSQSSIAQDFAIWNWVQIEKKIAPTHYVNFQYQIRFVENAQQFGRSNIYFSYSKDFSRNYHSEILYQLNTNLRNDQHTIYWGHTYKQLVNRKFTLFFRSAIQHTQRQFTKEIRIDKPSTEWRNRIRLAYKINKIFTITQSAEVYLKNTPLQPIHWSRMRYVSQLNFRYNKYQSFHLFYLVEPDLISYKQRETDYVLGFTYKIKLPNKWKDYKKLYQPKFKKPFQWQDDYEKENRDTY